MLPTYFVIPMPYNVNGEGPADPEETVGTDYEVWDACNCSVGRYPSRDVAQRVCDQMNNEAKG